MLLESPELILIVAILAGIMFLIGLVAVAISVFLFVKKKGMKVAGIPAWTAALAAGLLLTLVIPGAILFILILIVLLELGSQPPVVTCYAPMEDPLNTTTMAAGALIASRVEMLDRLHKDGRIPESLYRKLKK
jgi:hypothetical protein